MRIYSNACCNVVSHWKHWQEQWAASNKQRPRQGCPHEEKQSKCHSKTDGLKTGFHLITTAQQQNNYKTMPETYGNFAITVEPMGICDLLNVLVKVLCSLYVTITPCRVHVSLRAHLQTAHYNQTTTKKHSQYIVSLNTRVLSDWTTQIHRAIYTAPVLSLSGDSPLSIPSWTAACGNDPQISLRDPSRCLTVLVLLSLPIRYGYSTWWEMAMTLWPDFVNKLRFINVLQV